MRSLLVLLVAAPAVVAAPAAAQQKTETAIFAGGCFWCTEADFEKIPGVISAVSGYTGGREANPTYEQVVAKRTGHVEAVRVTYDPGKVTYGALVTQFWRTVDPTDAGGQFCDRGPTYRTAVFVATPAQRRAAETSKALAQKRLKKRVVTEIRDVGRFWPAEAYHQDYAKKNPLRYQVYRQGCGRDERLKSLWAGR